MIVTDRSTYLRHHKTLRSHVILRRYVFNSDRLFQVWYLNFWVFIDLIVVHKREIMPIYLYSRFDVDSRILPHNILSLIDSRLNWIKLCVINYLLVLLVFLSFLPTIISCWWSVIEYFITDFHTHIHISYQTTYQLYAIKFTLDLKVKYILMQAWEFQCFLLLAKWRLSTVKYIISLRHYSKPNWKLSTSTTAGLYDYTHVPNLCS